MITTLDRMILASFFRSYAIVWTSLISLFVVIDLFTHLDAYVSRPGGVLVIAGAHRPVLRVPDSAGVRSARRTDHADGRDVHARMDAAEQRTVAAAIRGHPDAAGRPPGVARRRDHAHLRPAEPRIPHPGDRGRIDDRTRRPGRGQSSDSDGRVRHVRHSPGGVGRLPARQTNRAVLRHLSRVIPKRDAAPDRGRGDLRAAAATDRCREDGC